MATLVLTFIADDRPGLVAELSSTCSAHRAGWESSRLARLAGKFAGIAEVSVADAAVDGLVAALDGLDGVQVTVERARDVETAEAHRMSLHLIGADRPGILSEITTLLAGRGVSVEELDSTVREAPMAGGLLFEVQAVLAAPPSADEATLRAALEALADELMVDVDLAV